MERKIFNFKIKPELKNEFQRVAESDGRTMSGALNHLIKGYINEKGDLIEFEFAKSPDGKFNNIKRVISSETDNEEEVIEEHIEEPKKDMKTVQQYNDNILTADLLKDMARRIKKLEKRIK